VTLAPSDSDGRCDLPLSCCQPLDRRRDIAECARIHDPVWHRIMVGKPSRQFIRVIQDFLS
jgi:hypothetical protein